MTDPSPGDVLIAATRAFAAGDVDGWLAYAHDDIVLELPYAPPGAPSRVAGKAAVADYLRAVPAGIDFRQMDFTVHQTVAPETAVIEWTAAGVVKATGAAYEMTYVVILTLQDGLMRTYRDYWNPLVLQNTLGAA